MRLVKVIAEEDLIADVKKLVFAAGIKSISLHSATKETANETAAVTILDFVSSTPGAKAFQDTLLKAQFFDPRRIQVDIRQGRSSVSDHDIEDLTKPLVEPSSDLNIELWQFSFVSWGLLGRVFVGGCILAYGMIDRQLILMIGGFLFLPMLPMLLAISVGLLSKQWRLAIRGLVSFMLSVSMLVFAGVLLALMLKPPIQFSDTMSPLFSIFISSVVGVAAGLATIDDTGRREMIGLAAAAQISIFPVWLGATFVFGPPAPFLDAGPLPRAWTFLANILSIIMTSSAVYLLSGIASTRLSAVLQK